MRVRLLVVSVFVVGCGGPLLVTSDASTDAPSTSTDTAGTTDAPVSAGDTGLMMFPDARPSMSTCTSPISLVDTSSATNVVGDGTVGSCTEAALRSALERRGVIRFSCGSAPVTIRITTELRLDGYTGDVVLDGGGLVTLDGGGTTRILSLRSSFERPMPRLTVQRLTFRNGYTTDVPNTTATNSGGAAIYRLGGTLEILDSTFENNVGPVTGQDVAGGAVYSIGNGGPTTIVRSVFRNNSCSDGGAIGNLHTSMTLVDSIVEGNTATGNGGNPGNGGNGGGIYMDGVGNTLVICGSRVSMNRGHAFGGGVFRVSNSGMPVTDIDRSSFESNEIVPNDFGMAGGLYLQGNTITFDTSTIAENRARIAGGLYVGPNSTIAMTNSTIASNTAKTSLGGGLFAEPAVSGTLLNCTFARNSAPASNSFAGAISGSGGLRLVNTLIAYSVAGNGYNPISCNRVLMDGGGNFQFPVMRSGSGSDAPGSLCAAGARTVDPLLGELGDHGGPTRTVELRAGSPAIGGGTGCPPLDQRGNPRARCDSGAVNGP